MLVKLSDIAEITMGQSPKSTAYNTNRIGLPFLQGRTTFGDMYPYFDTWTSSWNKEARENDILFTVRAPVGDINIATTNIAIGRGIASIRPKECSTKYLYYLLYANKSKFLVSSAGTIYDSINKEALENVKLSYHTPAEQNHIVNTIGTIDDLIEKYQEIVLKLGSFSTAIYNKYFKDIETNDISKLGDYCEIKTGKLNAEDCNDAGLYPFFTCGQTELRIDDYAFDCEAIIIAGNGEISVKYYKGKFNAYQRTYVLSPTKYFYLFLKECELSINDLKSNSQGSVIKFITKGMLENISIKNIPQINIANAELEKLYSMSFETKKKIEKLKEIKANLLSKYF